MATTPAERRRRERLLDSAIPRRLPVDLFETEVLDPLENENFRQRPIDPEMVRRLANLHMDDEEIAKVLDMPLADVQTAYGHIIDQGRQEALVALRRVRWRVAMRGNVQMLLHLSEQLLKEKVAPPPAPGGDQHLHLHFDDPRAQLLDAVREAADRLAGREVQPALPPAQIAAGEKEI